MADELGKHLHYLLQKDLRSRNGGADVKLSQDEENYMVDLIDYVVAMVKNGKPISYILDELKNMEMELFDWTKVGAYVEDFLRELIPNDNVASIKPVPEPLPSISSPRTHQSAADSRKMLHLKSNKSNALAMSGALGASRESRGQGLRGKTINDNKDAKTSGHSIDIPHKLNQGDDIGRKRPNVDRNKINDYRPEPVGNRNQAMNTSSPSGQDNRHSRPIGAQVVRGISNGSERDRTNKSRGHEGGRNFIPRGDHSRNHLDLSRDGAGRSFSQRQGGRGHDRLVTKATTFDDGRLAAQGSGRSQEISNKHQSRDSNSGAIPPRERLRDAGRGRGGVDERSHSHLTRPDSSVKQASNNRPSNPPSKAFDTKVVGDNSASRGPVIDNNNFNSKPGVEGSERKATKRNAKDLDVQASSLNYVKFTDEQVIPDRKATGEVKPLTKTVTKNSESTESNLLANAGKDPASNSTLQNDSQSFNRRVYHGQSNVSSARGRGQYRQLTSDIRRKDLIQQENAATIPVATDQAQQVSKKARLSTAMGVVTNPEFQSGEAQNVNNDMELDKSGELYTQPHGYELYDESQWYMEDPSYYAVHPYQWGRGRGLGRVYAFRGRSLKLGGRGVGATANGTADSVPHKNEAVNEEQPSTIIANDVTLAAASVSPSPLVAATFGDQLGHVETTYSYRGQGFRGRGSGRGRGRAEVTALLASKSWSRTKAAAETPVTVAPTEES